MKKLVLFIASSLLYISSASAFNVMDQTYIDRLHSDMSRRVSALERRGIGSNDGKAAIAVAKADSLAMVINSQEQKISELQGQLIQLKSDAESKAKEAKLATESSSSPINPLSIVALALSVIASALAVVFFIKTKKRIGEMESDVFVNNDFMKKQIEGAKASICMAERRIGQTEQSLGNVKDSVEELRTTVSGLSIK